MARARGPHSSDSAQDRHSAAGHGYGIFHVPGAGVPGAGLWALVAFLIGAVLLAWPLLATSELVRAGDAVMMQRSSAFFAVIVILAAVRYFARNYFDSMMTLEQTGGLFFILAFGMILRWRMRMLQEYRTLTAQPVAE